MNRRIVVPALCFCLALCFAIIALPAESASGARLQATTDATVDPCNPQPAVVGIIVADKYPVYAKALEGSAEVLIVRRNDHVAVLGRNDSGTWDLIQANTGQVGWMFTAYIQIDAAKLRKLPVVDGLVAVAQNTPTATPSDLAQATADAQMTATAYALACPVFTGTVTGDIVAVKTGPITTSKDAGVNVVKTDQVAILNMNNDGSWFKIRTKDGVEGWLLSAYVFIDRAKIQSIHHDYSDVEITLTPSS